MPAVDLIEVLKLVDHMGPFEKSTRQLHFIFPKPFGGSKQRAALFAHHGLGQQSGWTSSVGKWRQDLY